MNRQKSKINFDYFNIKDIPNLKNKRIFIFLFYFYLVPICIRFFDRSFLTRRWLQLDSVGALHRHPITLGVNQCLGLGQMLWSLIYDDLLRLDLPSGSLSSAMLATWRCQRWRTMSPSQRMFPTPPYLPYIQEKHAPNLQKICTWQYGRSNSLTNRPTNKNTKSRHTNLIRSNSTHWPRSTYISNIIINSIVIESPKFVM